MVERATDDVRLRIDSSIEAARQSQAVQHAFEAAADFAVLLAGERESAINELEEIFGRRLKIRQLRREIEKHYPERAQRKIQTAKPQIDLGLPWLQVVQQTALSLAVANDPPARFIWSNTLARVAEDEKGRKLVIPLTYTFLRGDMGRCITYFISGEKKGEVDMPPPMDVARDLLPRFNETLEALGATPLPPLNGLVESPVLRPDGSILDCPGYDPASGLYYWPAPGLEVSPISRHPSNAAVADAVALVDEAIGDFPFEASVDRTNAWALLLTVVLRSMVGLAPIAIVDAPQAGTGKSLLGRLVYAIANGRDGVMTSVPPADDEMRKLITALLLEGCGVVLLDNLDGSLFHSSLAKVITAPTWCDRMLGGNKMISVPQNARVSAIRVLPTTIRQSALGSATPGHLHPPAPAPPPAPETTTSGPSRSTCSAEARS